MKWTSPLFKQNLLSSTNLIRKSYFLMNFHDTHGFVQLAWWMNPLIHNQSQETWIGKCLLLLFFFCFREIKRAFVFYKKSFVVPIQTIFLNHFYHFWKYMLARIQKTKAWKQFLFHWTEQKSWIWALFLAILTVWKETSGTSAKSFSPPREPSMLSLTLFSFLLSFTWVTAGFSQIRAELKDCI